MTVAQNVAVVPSLLGWDPRRDRRARRRAAAHSWGSIPRDISRPASAPALRRRGAARRRRARDRGATARAADGRAVRRGRRVVRTALQRELVRIVAELQTTTLFVTHDVDEALRLADRIVVMRARPRRTSRGARSSSSSARRRRTCASSCTPATTSTGGTSCAAASCCARA